MNNTIKALLFMSLAFNAFLLFSSIRLAVNVNAAETRIQDLISINNAIEVIGEQNKRLRKTNKELERGLAQCEDAIRATVSSCQPLP